MFAFAAIVWVLRLPVARALRLLRLDYDTMLDARSFDKRFDLVASMFGNSHATFFDKLAGVDQTRLELFDEFQAKGQLAVEICSFCQVITDEPACPQ